MLIKNLTQKKYSTPGALYQLKLPLNIEVMIPEDDNVRLLSQIIEEMDLTELYATYSRYREDQISPRQMLKLIVYGYMNHKYSVRDIEVLCQRDINFMFLLEGKKAPSYSTISRFRSLHLKPVNKIIMSRLTLLLGEIGELSKEQIFIDGTKIEAASNKYTFVWKKAVTKHQEKLWIKIPEFVKQAEEDLGIQLIYTGEIRIYHLKKLRKRIKKIQKEEEILFVKGIGRRKSLLQKTSEKLEEYLERLKKYNHQIHKCGTRNSFSKTDPDATFMRMKEDAMMNGQLKPAYNIQLGTDAEYIVGIMVGPQCTDTTTLIPFLKEMEDELGYRYKKIVADAGYESEENYLYLEGQNQSAYIKPSNHEKAKTRKYKKDIGRYENMEYLELEDEYICANGKKPRLKYKRNVKSKTGYLSEKSIYECEECGGCAFKTECIKVGLSKTPLEKRTKTLQVAKEFIRMRGESEERITSDEGNELRINRSIQAEGAFGVIKENMGFRRFLCKGTENIETECILISMAYNIKKLHRKIQSGRCGIHLHKIKTA